MTFLRRLWSFVMPLAITRREPTIAEMRKASHFSEGQRYHETQPADPKKLRGERAPGKVKNFADWNAKHGRTRRSA